MKYLVDTDRVADYLSGRRDGIDLLNRLSHEALAISIITYGEIYEGIYFGRNRDEHERGFLKFLQGIDVLPLGSVHHALVRPDSWAVASARPDHRRYGHPYRGDSPTP